jgi:hypothetical protein
MDQYGLDKFSLVNFAVGLIWQQTGLSFLSLAIVYSIFKIFGNTSLGMSLIDNKYVPSSLFKMTPENYKNIAMDLGLCFTGWFVGHLITGSEFHNSTVSFIGLCLYFLAPELLTKYLLYIAPVLAVSGIIFRPMWFLLVGLGVAYGFDHYTLLKNDS